MKAVTIFIFMVIVTTVFAAGERRTREENENREGRFLGLLGLGLYGGWGYGGYGYPYYGGYYPSYYGYGYPYSYGYYYG